MYSWEVHGHSDANGYAAIIGFVETKTEDQGDATELAWFKFGRANVGYVCLSRF